MSVSKRQIGLVTATALVLGNMIGSGVFMLPATLAPYGGYSLVGCISPGNSPAWASIIPPRTFGLSLTATF